MPITPQRGRAPAPTPGRTDPAQATDVPVDQFGNIDPEWIDSLHRRLFACVEQGITAAERAQRVAAPDPVKQIREKVELLTKVFALRRAMREERHSWRKKRKRR